MTKIHLETPSPYDSFIHSFIYLFIYVFSFSRIIVCGLMLFFTEALHK